MHTASRIYIYICTHVCDIYVRTCPTCTCHIQLPRGMPRGDFSCKFAYKIDVNFYKTIIATIYVTIMLTKLRTPGRTYTELLLTASGTDDKVNALFRYI